MYKAYNEPNTQKLISHSQQFIQQTLLAKPKSKRGIKEKKTNVQPKLQRKNTLKSSLLFVDVSATRKRFHDCH